MASTLKTPGVYIEERDTFPNTAVAIATAVPVFIGYTEKAQKGYKSISKIPTRISSFAEFQTLFGGAFHTTFIIEDAYPTSIKEDVLKLNGTNRVLKAKEKQTLYLYNAIRLFYLNGGGDAYIISVGEYGKKKKGEGIEINIDDFIGEDEKSNVFKVLEKEFEPTLILMPDVIHRPSVAMKLYRKMLEHCGTTRRRFAILDVPQTAQDHPMEDIERFRKEIGTQYLSYGAAYYPWLATAVVQLSEINYTHLDPSVDLAQLLPEPDAQLVLEKMKAASPKEQEERVAMYHHMLLGASDTYLHILEAIRSKLNLLPPSAAIAGLYTLVDHSRGVWKASANISLSAVNAPAVTLSAEQQEAMNVDVQGGKSINAIRPFPGIGTLVWGARTLDGNSQDWRYINVMRTRLMIEQSVSLATRAYVFEPNVNETWVTVSMMLNNFLHNLWKQGALAGATAEDAYQVQVGLGSTMTPTDILDGIMRITIKVAILRPAEFFEITLQQQQQKS
jgi:phage tail sheath protein FI